MSVVIMNAWQILFKGGPMMWPILMLSILSMSIGVNRIFFLLSLERKIQADKHIFLDSLRNGNLKETLRLCEQKPGVLSSIIKAGLVQFGHSRDLIKGAMEEVYDYQSSLLNKYMDFLSVIVNIAPLMGLLGSISAMTVVFHAVQIRSNVLNPLTAGELAAGIWQALLTTCAGLIVGIFSYAVYFLCISRIQGILRFLQRIMIEITNVLQQLAELKHSSKEHAHED